MISHDRYDSRFEYRQHCRYPDKTGNQPVRCTVKRVLPTTTTYVGHVSHRHLAAAMKLATAALPIAALLLLSLAGSDAQCSGNIGYNVTTPGYYYLFAGPATGANFVNSTARNPAIPSIMVRPRPCLRPRAPLLGVTSFPHSLRAAETKQTHITFAAVTSNAMDCRLGSP